MKETASLKLSWSKKVLKNQLSPKLSLWGKEDFILWSFKLLLPFSVRVVNSICPFQCSWDSTVSMQHLHKDTKMQELYTSMQKSYLCHTHGLPRSWYSISFEVVWGLQFPYDNFLKSKRAKKRSQPTSNNKISQCFGQTVQAPTFKSSQITPCSVSWGFIRIKVFLISWRKRLWQKFWSNPLHLVVGSISSNHNMPVSSRERLNIFR